MTNKSNMTRIYLAILFGILSLDARSQSPLPACSDDTLATWNRCFGVFTNKFGITSSGEWKDNHLFGKGSLISPKGHVIVEGIWSDDFNVFTSGSRWAQVSTTDNGFFFVSKDSIKQENTFRRAWIMESYLAPTSGALSMRVLEKFDCANERHKILAGTLHSGNFGSGEIVRNIPEGQWDYAPPGTAVEGVFKFICGYKLPLPQKLKGTP